MNQTKNKFKTGFVCIVGKPNVGKSTLINQLVGAKISITANKPQTTRQLIRGIKTTNMHQIIFIDTPGIQEDKHIDANLMNLRMNKRAKQSLNEVDLILFLTDIQDEFDEDEIEILSSIKALNSKSKKSIPVFLGVNKSDILLKKDNIAKENSEEGSEKLMNILKEKSESYPFSQILPISAFEGNNLKKLNQLMVRYLPESEMLFCEDEVTDSPLFRRVEEMIREKCMRDLYQEIPFKVAIKVNQIEKEEKIVRIQADIWVTTLSHKKIVIGSKGKMIKAIGIHGRYNLEKNLFKKKVYLELLVKVQKDWFNKLNLLDNLCI